MRDSSHRSESTVCRPSEGPNPHLWLGKIQVQSTSGQHGACVYGLDTQKGLQSCINSGAGWLCVLPGWLCVLFFFLLFSDCKTWF